MIFLPKLFPRYANFVITRRLSEGRVIFLFRLFSPSARTILTWLNNNETCLEMSIELLLRNNIFMKLLTEICKFNFHNFFFQESDLLNFGTGSVSWFEVNGYGCKPIYPINLTSIDDPFRPIRPSQVDECFVEYPIVEVFHSSVQSFLAVSFF